MANSPSYTISVVIPTYNRPGYLRDCLESLTRSAFPHEDFQVIVIDDGSPQAVHSITKPFESDLNIRCIRQENLGPASGRNRGVSESLSRYIAFIDDDCQADPQWLRALVNSLDETPDMLIGGRTPNGISDNVYTLTSQVILEVVYAFYNFDPDQPSFFASNNIALSRDRFLEIGGFDTAFPLAAAEDREFCDRWRFSGRTLRYAPDAIVMHFHSMNLISFFRQQYNYGRGAYHYHLCRQKRKSGKLRHDIRMHAALPKLLRVPLSRLVFGVRMKVIFLLVIWQVANALGFFREALVGDRNKACDPHRPV